MCPSFFDTKCSIINEFHCKSPHCGGAVEGGSNLDLTDTHTSFSCNVSFHVYFRRRRKTEQKKERIFPFLFIFVLISTVHCLVYCLVLFFGFSLFMCVSVNSLALEWCVHIQCKCCMHQCRSESHDG